MKLLHCCWLGEAARDAQARRCRASWERFAPKLAIREWTFETLGQVEREHQLAIPPFVREAIARRKWAFAADWVRFAALYLEGGVYFDYDFELVQPIDDLLAQGEFVSGQWMRDGSVGLEPAIIALEQGSPIARAMLDYYAHAAFDDRTTVGAILAQQLADRHLALKTLPPEVFSPIDVRGECHRTAETRGIHHYAMSWATPQRRLAKWLSWHGLRKVVEWLLALRGK